MAFDSSGVEYLRYAVNAIFNLKRRLKSKLVSTRNISGCRDLKLDQQYVLSRAVQ